MAIQELWSQDGFERSSELLRLAIPLMSRQKAGLHPLSYAVWYQYVSGRDRKLIQAVDNLLQAGDSLDEAKTQSLFLRYILHPDQSVAKDVNAQLELVISEVNATAEDSARNAETYGESLDEFSHALSNGPGPSTAGDEPLKSGLDKVLRETKGIRSSIDSLQTVLEAGRREIEQLREQLQQTQEEAYSDALTGLRNRKGFNLSLRTAIAEAVAENQPLALVLLDIDHFKKVNDTYGHLLGDKVLRLVAQTLRDNVKGADTVSRFGGEEFAILLPRTGTLGAKAVAAAVCSRIARGRVRDLKGQTIEHVTASAGVGEYRRGETEEEFIGRVDAALYRSKREGRDRISCAPMG